MDAVPLEPGPRADSVVGTPAPILSLSADRFVEVFLDLLVGKDGVESVIVSCERLQLPSVGV